MDKRGGGGREYHNFLSEIFCLTAEKFRRETLLCCFRKFRAAKKFMDKKGEYQDFPSIIFLSHIAEKLRR